MKKRNLMMMIALVATATGTLQANQEVAAAPATEIAATTLSNEELAFAAKLSDRTRKSFTQMTADQRKAVMVAATDPAVGADGAVDKVMKSCSASCDRK